MHRVAPIVLFLMVLDCFMDHVDAFNPITSHNMTGFSNNYKNAGLRSSFHGPITKYSISERSVAGKNPRKFSNSTYYIENNPILIPLKTYFSFIIAENVTILDFVGVWTYNLTVNVGHSSGEQKDLEIHIECSKSSENGFQCIGAGDTELASSYYTILSNGSIEYDEDPSFQATLQQNGILFWYENGTLIDTWEKQGIIMN